jgi:hypothetical protein
MAWYHTANTWQAQQQQSVEHLCGLFKYPLSINQLPAGIDPYFNKPLPLLPIQEVTPPPQPSPSESEPVITPQVISPGRKREKSLRNEISPPKIQASKSSASVKRMSSKRFSFVSSRKPTNAAADRPVSMISPRAQGSAPLPKLSTSLPTVTKTSFPAQTLELFYQRSDEVGLKHNHLELILIFPSLLLQILQEGFLWIKKKWKWKRKYFQLTRNVLRAFTTSPKIGVRYFVLLAFPSVKEITGIYLSLG